ncbi:MAG TPA: hypothetical protein PLY86_05235 [bacterium]|nr:hypothetical protein [bacterium]
MLLLIMNRIYRETLACSLIACLFYIIVWWILGTRFFGLGNPYLIAGAVLFAIADIGAIYYLIRRKAARSQMTDDGE